MTITSVWDLQTGATIDEPETRDFGKLAFSANGGNVNFFKNRGDLLRYSVLRYEWLGQGFEFPQSYESGAHWIHEDTLRIATSFETDGVYVVEIQEVQPTSTPSLHLLASFPAPPHESGFSFSPASYHASFGTGMEIIVLDVRDSRVLLRTEVARAHPQSLERFSPDGRFFACGVSEREIRVWQNTPTGYVPWSNLRSRLPFEGFSFSPTTPSILTWGPGGIQLLYPDDRLSPPSPDNGRPNHQQRDHLVAYSADHAHIATARKEDGMITVLDPLSGTLRRSINTNMEIREIGIVDDTIFVANSRVLAWWDLKTGERAHGTHAVLEAAAIVVDPRTRNLAFSHDYSHIAFSVAHSHPDAVDAESTVILYDVNAQKIIAERKLANSILAIRFFPNTPRLRLLTHRWVLPFQQCFTSQHSLVELDPVEGGGSGAATHSVTADAWPWVGLFSRGCRIWGQWVVDSRGSKLLWLPPSWRAKRWDEARWDGSFLALLDGRYELPIIIEFCP